MRAFAERTAKAEQGSVNRWLIHRLSNRDDVWVPMHLTINYGRAPNTSENGRWGSVFTSASPGCLDGGDVDLLHRHHRLEGTLCLTATSRKRIG